MVAPLLVDDEQLAAGGIGWGVALRPRVPVWLLARHQYFVALTDRRLIVLIRRRRRGVPDQVALARQLSTLALERVRSRWPLSQVWVRTTPTNTLLLEFRRREQAVGRAVAAALPSGSGADRMHHGRRRDAPEGDARPGRPAGDDGPG
jgi:hypothetical protein